MHALLGFSSHRGNHHQFQVMLPNEMAFLDRKSCLPEQSGEWIVFHDMVRTDTQYLNGAVRLLRFEELQVGDGTFQPLLPACPAGANVRQVCASSPDLNQSLFKHRFSLIPCGGPTACRMCRAVLIRS